MLPLSRRKRSASDGYQTRLRGMGRVRSAVAAQKDRVPFSR